MQKLSKCWIHANDLGNKALLRISVNDSRIGRTYITVHEGKTANLFKCESQLPRPEGHGLRLRTKSCRVWVADSSGWLPCGLGKLNCSPRLTGEGSCAILSPRPVTRSHAPVRLFVLLSTGRLSRFIPSEGYPAFSGSIPTESSKHRFRWAR
jgi:hypothetical protein